jgi:TolB protein
MKSKLMAALGALLIVTLTAFTAEEAGDVITVEKAGQARLVIPVSLSGFGGEVETVLRFDLEVLGFKIVNADQANYNITGSNEGNLQGRVTDRMNKAVLLERAYSGGSARTQAHAFADEIVEKLRNTKGIARTKIAYKVDTGSNSEIYVSDYDGFGALAITKDNTISAAPSWVPGERILYYYSYKQGNPDIYMHDLSGGMRKAVARYPGLNISPAPSPDGTKVAMILSKSGSPDLYVMDEATGNLKQLTTTREAESSPCWSPDGQSICFVSREGGRPALYTVPAGGGKMRRLATGIGSPTEPDWSPDGKTIAFTAMGRDFSICTVPAGGGSATVLVSGEDPSWAPNSRTVIFTRRRGDRRVLSLLDVPTKQVKDVPQLSGSCSQPSWAR